MNSFLNILPNDIIQDIYTLVNKSNMLNILHEMKDIIHITHKYTQITPGINIEKTRVYNKIKDRLVTYSYSEKTKQLEIDTYKYKRNIWDWQRLNSSREIQVQL
jgi:hypothetical protein